MYLVSSEFPCIPFSVVAFNKNSVLISVIFSDFRRPILSSAQQVTCLLQFSPRWFSSTFLISCYIGKLNIHGKGKSSVPGVSE